MPNYLTSEEELRRQDRARHFYAAAAVAAGVVGFGLLIALRGMLLPVAIGMVLAYLCLPLLGYLKNKGLSRSGAILVLFGISSLLPYSVLNLASHLIPDKKTELELQVRASYKLNEKFNAMMGLDAEGRGGNWLYSSLGEDLEPLRETIDMLLALSGEEQRLFNKLHQAAEEGPGGVTPASEKYWRYYQANQARDQAKVRMLIKKRPADTVSDVLSRRGDGGSHGSLLRTIFNAAALWLVTPLVFLTLLFDDGRLKRGFIRNVPNRYFELTLTVIDHINSALGRYLRGTALECFLVGMSMSFCLFLIGFDPRWAVVIGTIAGLANAIPFLGTAIGLVVGILYAIMAEEITPILPFINDTNLIAGVVASVFLVHLADNAIFQPYILGGAVDLHPLVVILGVMGGTVLFGFTGLLFAIPTIIVVKVVVTTTIRQLRAYYII